MPSIRRALILYFLLLMGLTLALGGVFVHRIVAAALEARDAADARRLSADADAKCREIQAQFDKELLADARAVALDYRRHRDVLRANSDARTRLALALVPFGAGSHALSAETTVAALNVPAVRRRAAEWVAEDDPARRTFDPDDHLTSSTFQVHFPPSGGRPGFVVKPSAQPFELPLDPDTLDRGPPSWDAPARASDVDAPGVGTLRVVVLRAPFLFNQQPRTGGRPGGPGGGPGGPPGPGPDRGDRPSGPRPAGDAPPGVYVQFARPRHHLDDRLAGPIASRDAEISALPGRTRDDLAHTWAVLAAVAAGLLTALPVGGWFLVGRGLRPLAALTHAVSRVNERDFRLPIHAEQMSPELVPIHARLTATLDALRRAFDREKQAVGDISHELRTPLAALQTTLDVALRKPREAGQYRATLEDCRDITKQLARLVDRILTLATLDAGEAPSRLPVNVAELASECAAVIRPLAEGHNLHFAADLDAAATSTTDPDKLREVMMNLLHNAVEYNRPGGDIRLTVKKAAAGVSITVADTGIGMTPAVQERIFQRFYRADPSRHATGVHAGLGLAIVKEYVDRLNGRLTVTSEPGTGSRFEVAIPAVTA